MHSDATTYATRSSLMFLAGPTDVQVSDVEIYSQLELSRSNNIDSFTLYTDVDCKSD
jgi:hypothetical protein